MDKKCNLTPRCRFHRKWDNSALTCYTSIGFNYIQWLKHDDSGKTSAKEITMINDLVCQVLNLEALGALMSKYGMKVHNVSIHKTFPTVPGNVKCWGYNEGQGDTIALRVVKYRELLFTRDELLSLVIHELVHMDFHDHDQQFYEREALYRKFIKSRMYVRIWEDHDNDTHFENVLLRSFINDVVDKMRDFKIFKLTSVVLTLFQLMASFCSYMIRSIVLWLLLSVRHTSAGES